MVRGGELEDFLPRLIASPVGHPRGRIEANGVVPAWAKSGGVEGPLGVSRIDGGGERDVLGSVGMEGQQRTTTTTTCRVRVMDVGRSCFVSRPRLWLLLLLPISQHLHRPIGIRYFQALENADRLPRSGLGRESMPIFEQRDCRVAIVKREEHHEAEARFSREMACSVGLEADHNPGLSSWHLSHTDRSRVAWSSKRRHNIDSYPRKARRRWFNSRML